jgi:hypothetical protein
MIQQFVALILQSLLEGLADRSGMEVLGITKSNRTLRNRLSCARTLRIKSEIVCGSWMILPNMSIYPKKGDHCGFYALRIGVYLGVWLIGRFAVRLIYSQKFPTWLWTPETSQRFLYRSIEIFEGLKWENLLTRKSLRQKCCYFINLILHRVW